MRYVNTLTGAVLETKSTISGANWQEVTSAGAHPVVKEETKKAEPVKEDPEDDDSDLEVGEVVVPEKPKKGRKK